MGRVVLKVRLSANLKAKHSRAYYENNVVEFHNEQTTQSPICLFTFARITLPHRIPQRRHLLQQFLELDAGQAFDQRWQLADDFHLG